MKTELGMTIKALRKMRQMTQKELASRVGLERTSICNIELGRQVLTETTINAIAKALGYRVTIKFELIAPIEILGSTLEVSK